MALKSVCESYEWWCGVALPANEKKHRLGLILLLRLCFQRIFIQLLVTLTLQTEFCSFYTQGRGNSAVLSDSSTHTRTHTHNRSLRIFIGLAQFDRSLNLPASLILDKRTRKNTSAKECVRQCIDLDRWLRGQKQGKQLCMLNEGIKHWQPSNNKKIIKMLY